jgi:meso-butanediol dehydrogenase/(S,S)-butanediol dehydrogenase/diacetyl reductase
MPTEHRLSRGPVEGRLAGKIAVITGAGGGQGREVALLFAKAGASVIGCGRSAEGLAATRVLAEEAGLTIDLACVDVSDEASVTTWIDGATERHGGIDILYNNAASVRFAPFAEMTAEQWHYTLRNELDTVFFPSRAVWRHMTMRGGGSIVNVASVAGMRGMEVVENAGATAHAAGKGGVLGFSRQLATEGAAHWIRVNAIAPGPIATPGVEAVVAASPEFKEFLEGITLLKRFGQSVDVAYMALFLASDESAFVTGAEFVVDGGAASRMGVSMLSVR